MYKGPSLREGVGGGLGEELVLEVGLAWLAIGVPGRDSSDSWIQVHGLGSNVGSDLRFELYAEVLMKRFWLWKPKIISKPERKHDR